MNATQTVAASALAAGAGGACGQVSLRMGHLIAPRHAWTEPELAVLREQYPYQRTSDIALLLGMPVGSVYSQANRMGLRKSTAFQATSKSGRILKGGSLGQAMQFKPGQTPWNAGTHYVAGGRSAETRFKPGQQPHTTLPIGAYRTTTDKTGRQTLERKTSNCKGANHMRWTPVARLVWQATHGPVPAGLLVVFRRGMHTTVLEQITPDRLECITRAEHARRNHPNQSDPEFARLVQLKGAITRQVNRIKKESETS